MYSILTPVVSFLLKKKIQVPLVSDKYHVTIHILYMKAFDTMYVGCHSNNSS